MSNEIAIRRKGTHLVAVDPVSEEEISLIPADRDVLITWRTPRNIKQHRYAWALAQKIADSVDGLHDREDAMDFLKIKCRHVKYLTDPRTGQVSIVPKSISFASMTQAQFSRFLNRAVYVTCSEIIPGLEEGVLRAELEAMTADARK